MRRRTPRHATVVARQDDAVEQDLAPSIVSSRGWQRQQRRLARADGPMRQTTSPRATCIETPSSATKLP